MYVISFFASLFSNFCHLFFISDIVKLLILAGDVSSVGILSMSSVAPLNLVLKNAGSDVVNGNYNAKNPKTIPVGFAK